MSTLPIAVPQEGLRARIREFFYKPEVPYGMALARIVLPLVLLFAMDPFWYLIGRELFAREIGRYVRVCRGGSEVERADEKPFARFGESHGRHDRRLQGKRESARVVL